MRPSPDVVGGGVGAGNGLHATVDATTYGFLKLGGADVAVELKVLREVVPRPAELSELIVQTDELVGAMDLRGVVVPVVDVRQLIGRGRGRSVSDDNVVIVVREGRTFGLVAEEINGIHRVPTRDLRPIALPGRNSALLSHTFLHPDGGHVVSLLDVDRLMALPGVPTIEEPSTEDVQARRIAEGRRSFTLFRCGDRTLAIDVVDVHTVLPGTVPRPSVLADSSCFGVTRFMDLDVAVVDPLQLSCIGRFDRDAVGSGAGMVLSVADGFVVLAISEALDIVDVETAAIHPVASNAVERADLFEGLLDLDDHGICLVLDADRLRTEASIPALARLAMPTDAPDGEPVVDDAGGPSIDDAGTSYLIFETDRAVDGHGRAVEWACPLDQVDEILPLRKEILPTSGRPGVMGILPHRDEMIPVVCLASVLGGSRLTLTSSSCLLIVHAGGTPVAFAVDGLVDIAPLEWRDAAAETRTRRSRSDETTITLGDSTRLRYEVDLAELAVGLACDGDDATGVESRIDGDRAGRLVA